ncbi:PREDICTED: uncharacterized protein LOC101296825 [Fragaria vesca subsp. vesca]|uniref:uncharacterized protein LOC101296825 n=1 Tax=Fragaria vesca subsp. vesca TaxID=101020 RepID=UPI0002C376FE|nr:PREDICTED: uncharacterized protein LOC101296825 [Fragaria vesca subsp. vesca]
MSLRQRVMEAKEPTTMMCTLVAIDHTDFSYRACSLCERTLPDNPSSLCRYCKPSAFNPRFPRTKRFFRVLMSVASDSKVFTVICFDRVAKVLFGCSADEFFDFAKFHPFAATNASRILEGEMFKMAISKPKNGNAQNLRAVQVVPLRTGFQPAIVTLRELYGVRSS